jgi:hypothetical protein
MTGPFSFGLGLIWPFPMYSRGAKRGIITFYAANNVAFRRDTLLAYPLPPDTPVYRGNCAVQSNRMRQAGLRIHFAQAARSLHPPPATGFTTFFWRFLISGHDWLIWHRLSPGHRTGVAGLWQDVVVFVRTALRWAVRPFVKIPMLVREAPIRALWLPIALPLAAVAWVLFCVGFVVTLFRPNAIIAAGTPHMEH